MIQVYSVVRDPDTLFCRSAFNVLIESDEHATINGQWMGPCWSAEVDADCAFLGAARACVLAARARERYMVTGEAEFEYEEA